MTDFLANLDGTDLGLLILMIVCFLGALLLADKKR